MYATIPGMRWRECRPPGSSNSESAKWTSPDTPVATRRNGDIAPRCYVITLSGTLEFETRLGEKFALAPGTILLAEDTRGGGHKWHLTDDQPWRRVYVGLE